MFVFSREKYIAVEGLRDYSVNRGWVDLCDGHPVYEDPRYRGLFRCTSDRYCIDAAWVIEVN